jgi:hypothetical protein
MLCDQDEQVRRSGVKTPLSMLSDEAIRIARAVAEREGWPWVLPVQAIQKRKFPWLGKPYWQVRTNSKFESPSVHVRIDNATARVLGAGYNPY